MGNKRGGNTGFWSSSSYKKRFFKLTKLGEQIELQYYNNATDTTAKKEDKGLAIFSSGLYFQKVGKDDEGDLLHLYSGGLAGDSDITETILAEKAKRIGHNWVQHLRFGADEDMNAWIKTLTRECRKRGIRIQKIVSENSRERLGAVMPPTTWSAAQRQSNVLNELKPAQLNSVSRRVRNGATSINTLK